MITDGSNLVVRAVYFETRTTRVRHSYETDRRHDVHTKAGNGMIVSSHIEYVCVGQRDEELSQTVNVGCRVGASQSGIGLSVHSQGVDTDLGRPRPESAVSLPRRHGVERKPSSGVGALPAELPAESASASVLRFQHNPASHSAAQRSAHHPLHS